ncbi:MAG: GerMN domain-containing protein [Anaerolineae bacterium]|nr:GerMN domain-containing protein [Anaerolineae bacterium]
MVPQTAATATPIAVAPTETATLILPSITPTSAPVLPPTPRPTDTPAPVDQVITLDMPAPGQTVENPLQLRGQVKILPFEGTLVIRIIDSSGQVAAEVPIIADGTIGGPATFEATVTYVGIPGPGRVEVLDISAKDGSIIAKATAQVTLAGLPVGRHIELPPPRADVTLPIRLLARVGAPGQDVNVRVTWDDGTQFSHVFPALAGLDGRGLLVVPLDVADPGFRHPPTQNGTIQIHTIEGSTLAWQPVRILAPDDPGTVGTNVFWVVDETVVAQQIRIPQTLGIGRASLEVLLWGPVPQNDSGYTTLIPGPEQVLAYGGRSPEWGERPELRDLTIENGIAYADFSLELSAHAGGAMLTSLIREQIEATLTQFSTVEGVVISINGVTGVLEP